jgi:hypothetical protein
VNGIQSINSSKNSTQLDKEMPNQRVESAVVAPGGSLILKVFDNFLVFHKTERKTTTPPRSSGMDNVATTTDNVATTTTKTYPITTTDITPVTSTETTSAEKLTTSTSLPTSTTVTAAESDRPKPFVNIVRNVSEVFCKICSTFGHQWKDYCKKKNCMVSSEPASL